MPAPDRDCADQTRLTDTLSGMQRGLLPRAVALAFVALVLTLLVAALLVWRPGGASLPGASPVIPPAPSGDAAVLVGAGDIAECGDDDDESTADLVALIPGTVFVAGDNAYRVGSAREYRDCYEPSWGAFLDRTRPVPGDNEYDTSGAAGVIRLILGPDSWDFVPVAGRTFTDSGSDVCH